MSTTFHSVDPRSGEQGPAFHEATTEPTSRAAVAAAEAVHRSGALGDVERRAALLDAAARRLRAAGDEIVAVAVAETGLPEARLHGELERTAGQLEAFAAVVRAGDHVEAIIDTPDPDAKPIPRPDIRRMLVPIGPIAVFGASNFPLAFSVAGGDTASALAAGCPVVVKGHPSHPGTGAVVARELEAAASEAGLPEGTFALLQAAGVEVGEALVDEPAIAAVGFTGSLGGGRALFDRAAARSHPIPVYAEMGSVNPIVVTEAALTARADAIAEGLAASVGTFGGQLCTKPGVVFVPAGAAGDAFTGAVGAKLAARDPEVLLNERLRDALTASVEALGELAQSVALPGAPDGPGFRFRPAAYAATAADLVRSPALLDERFGPIVLLLSYNDHDELLDAVARLEGQLTGTVHAGTGDEQLVGRARGAAHRPRGPRALRRLPDRRRRHPRHAPRRSLPGHHGARPHVGRHDRAAPLPAPGRLPERAGATCCPPELHDDNPRGIWRRVDGQLTRDRSGAGS